MQTIKKQFSVHDKIITNEKKGSNMSMKKRDIGKSNEHSQKDLRRLREAVKNVLAEFVR